MTPLVTPLVTQSGTILETEPIPCAVVFAELNAQGFAVSAVIAESPMCSECAATAGSGPEA